MNPKKKELSSEEQLAELLKGIDSSLPISPSTSAGLEKFDKKTLVIHEKPVERTVGDEKIQVLASIVVPQWVLTADKALDNARDWYNKNSAMMVQVEAKEWKRYIDAQRDSWWARVRVSLPLEMMAIGSKNNGSYYWDEKARMLHAIMPRDENPLKELFEAASEGRVKFMGSGPEGLLDLFKKMNGGE